MKNGVFLFVVGVLTFFGTVLLAHTDLETVWLKDITSSLQTDKRTISDLDLPDDLTFHLSRGSHAVNLNLKRNHGIDPNAEVYVVRKLKDGRSIPEKTRNLEKADVAYYQDRDNGAFMTVRCVKRSNGQYDRVINGNIRIGGRNYDLQPADTDVTSTTLLDVPDILGKRYVLRDQTNIQREISVENKDAANDNKKNPEEKLVDLFRRFSQKQDKGNQFRHKNSTLSSRDVAGVHNRDKKDNVKQSYWVEIIVLIDSTVWDLFVSLEETNYAYDKKVQAQRNIREAFSHIINGVNLLYNGIEDSSIEISVTLREFYIFQAMHSFPHRKSRMKRKDGINYMDVRNYLDDISYWDQSVGHNYSEYDHAMLFTRYDLYTDFIANNHITGMSKMSSVCDIGERVSVIEIVDFFGSIDTATHELGHNLGAVHDGEGVAQACPAEDHFIMTPEVEEFTLGDTYSRNPWLFSNCSVESFKTTLAKKTCLLNVGVSFNEEEWGLYVQKEPGERNTPDEQCKLSNGPKSRFYGVVSADICLFMKCTDPNTGAILSHNFIAARGTKCGGNMWCIEGRCVPKL